MRRTALILILLAMLLPCSNTASAADKASGPPEKPTEKDKCPVCGMFVYKYPDWVSAVVPKAGKTLYFDGAKDMFRFLRENSSPATAWVTEYYGLKMIEAAKAFYVLGSDVYGPMGHELVPFATKEEAGEFMADHKGRRILTFHEVDAEILKELK